MLYDVTYQVGGQEHVERVDAPDAAAAAAAVQRGHAGPDELFELIYVHLLEDLQGSEEPALDDETDRVASGVDAAD